MKILVLANRDIASNVALNELFQSCLDKYQFQVLLSSSVGKKSQNKPQSLKDLAFFEQDLFNQILFPALENPKNTAPKKLRSFGGFRELGIKVTDVHSINCQAGIATVQNFAPDLIVSIRFGLILQSAVIAIPKFGVINLHSGELPTYRGVMATFRAMQSQDTHCGTTLHYINDSGIDSGEIIKISKQTVDYQRSYLFNTLAVYKQGIKDVIEAINTIEQTGKCETLAAKLTGNLEASYYSFPSEQELATFHAEGHKLYEYQDVIAISKGFTKGD
ncbi:formyl transferase [uncultured Paraglaciecola sp.]|uniref:formyl transferase n=1 Tax=uncultured Paraglaciecola sp. TaxID=1765024 RepID=UPI002613686E|nr:formyl transferase [uncultured Paraglaciecola sp.]